MNLVQSSCNIHLPMLLTDPNVPAFHLWLGNDKVASLFDPEIIGRFFLCSYRVEPVSSETVPMLQDKANWDESKFTIKDMKSVAVSARYGADQTAFCQGKTQCVVFQFLLPPIARIDRRPIRRRGMKSVLKILLFDGVLLLGLGLLSYGRCGMWRFNLLLPVGISLAFICLHGVEFVSGIPLPVWNWRWLLLAGWQRGIIGMLAVLSILAAIILGVAAVFNWVIR
jgi:hypothetical protein